MLSRSKCDVRKRSHRLDMCKRRRRYLTVGLCGHSLSRIFLVTGPKKWGGDCQTGEAQTPIDIKSLQTTWKKDFGSPTLTNYNEILSDFAVKNNGHSLTISFPDDVYNVSGIGLTDVYTTVQFHLHWGSTNMKGSEHFLDGKQYAAEVGEIKENGW